MDKFQLLNIVSFFTKEEWQQFDNLRNLMFQPTQAEIDLQNQQNKQSQVNYLTQKLALYGITFVEPTNEIDWRDLFTAYIKGDPNCAEWLGGDLDKKINDYMELGAIKGCFSIFFDLVSQLES
jgi:hypothetical protein